MTAVASLRRRPSPPANDAAQAPRPANDLAPVVALLEGLLHVVRAAAPPPEPTTEPPPYESIAGFAARLDVSEKTVRRMIVEGMPHKRPRPRTVRIPVADAEAWIAGQTERGGIAMAQRRAVGDARRGAH